LPAHKLSQDAKALSLNAMHQAAREGGDIAMSFFKSDLKVWDKGSNDGRTNPVSEADLAVNDHLANILKTACPTYGWISEETEAGKSRFEQQYVWVVDPIDGTRAFIKGRPHFTVCIALLEDNRPILGTVFNPATDEFFQAELGNGALLNEEPIQVSNRAEIEGCNMIGSPDIFRSPKWPEPWPDMTIEQRNSMAYRMTLVATGQFDATIAFTRKHDWDLAAAGLIAEEAGALVTHHNGAKIKYNTENMRHPSVLCAGPELYGRLLDRVKDLPIT
jgi:myo-inositol-1(or 4)-monophosphatase